jgi:hypothetical protein
MATAEPLPIYLSYSASTSPGFITFTVVTARPSIGVLLYTTEKPDVRYFPDVEAPGRIAHDKWYHLYEVFCLPQNEPGEVENHTFTIPAPAFETTYWVAAAEQCNENAKQSYGPLQVFRFFPGTGPGVGEWLTLTPQLVSWPFNFLSLNDCLIVRAASSGPDPGIVQLNCLYDEVFTHTWPLYRNNQSFQGTTHAWIVRPTALPASFSATTGAPVGRAIRASVPTATMTVAATSDAASATHISPSPGPPLQSSYHSPDLPIRGPYDQNFGRFTIDDLMLGGPPFPPQRACLWPLRENPTIGPTSFTYPVSTGDTIWRDYVDYPVNGTVTSSLIPGTRQGAAYYVYYGRMSLVGAGTIENLSQVIHEWPDKGSNRR